MARSVRTNDPVSLFNGRSSSASDAAVHLETRSILTVNPSLWLNDDTRGREWKCEHWQTRELHVINKLSKRQMLMSEKRVKWCENVIFFLSDINSNSGFILMLCSKWCTLLSGLYITVNLICTSLCTVLLWLYLLLQMHLTWFLFLWRNLFFISLGLEMFWHFRISCQLFLLIGSLNLSCITFLRLRPR